MLQKAFSITQPMNLAFRGRTFKLDRSQPIGKNILEEMAREDSVMVTVVSPQAREDSVMVSMVSPQERAVKALDHLLSGFWTVSQVNQAIHENDSMGEVFEKFCQELERRFGDDSIELPDPIGKFLAKYEGFLDVLSYSIGEKFAAWQAKQASSQVASVVVSAPREDIAAKAEEPELFVKNQLDALLSGRLTEDQCQDIYRHLIEEDYSGLIFGRLLEALNDRFGSISGGDLPDPIAKLLDKYGAIPGACNLSVQAKFEAWKNSPVVASSAATGVSVSMQGHSPEAAASAGSSTDEDTVRALKLKLGAKSLISEARQLGDDETVESAGLDQNSVIRVVPTEVQVQELRLEAVDRENVAHINFKGIDYPIPIKPDTTVGAVLSQLRENASIPASEEIRLISESTVLKESAGIKDFFVGSNQFSAIQKGDRRIRRILFRFSSGITETYDVDAFDSVADVCQLLRRGAVGLMVGGKLFESSALMIDEIGLEYTGGACIRVISSPTQSAGTAHVPVTVPVTVTSFFNAKGSSPSAPAKTPEVLKQELIDKCEAYIRDHYKWASGTHKVLVFKNKLSSCNLDSENILTDLKTWWTEVTQGSDTKASDSRINVLKPAYVAFYQELSGTAASPGPSCCGGAGGPA